MYVLFYFYLKFRKLFSNIFGTFKSNIFFKAKKKLYTCLFDLLLLLYSIKVCSILHNFMSTAYHHRIMQCLVRNHVCMHKLCMLYAAISESSSTWPHVWDYHTSSSVTRVPRPQMQLLQIYISYFRLSFWGR